MAQRYGEDFGRSGRREDDDWRSDRYTSGSRGSRSDEESGFERDRSRGRSRFMREDSDVRFGRNVGDVGDYPGEGNLRDFSDRTSQGRHSGYGDYGQQDYRSQGGGGLGDVGGGRDYSLGSGMRRESTRWPRDTGDYGFGRSDYGRGFERNEEQRGDFDEGRVSYGYGRRDYRGNLGAGGYGYAESAYGPGRYARGAGQDWSSNQPRGEQYGSYRGRGPKGYKPSDERLQEIICEKLTDDPDIDASDITVTVKEQVVTLDGTVGDRWTKYQVEELVERRGGVNEVRNQLRIQRPGQQETSQQYGSSSSTGTREGESGGGASTRGKSQSSSTTKPF
jgi:osmotically-inducible protein OsmY